MDDAKIDQIAREVLTSLRNSRAGSRGPAAVPTQAPASSSSVEPRSALHASLQLLNITGGVVGSPCIIEPDKPCIGSLKCRTFGH